MSCGRVKSSLPKPAHRRDGKICQNREEEKRARGFANRKGITSPFPDVKVDAEEADLALGAETARSAGGCSSRMPLAQEFVETGISKREIGHTIANRITLPCFHALDKLPIVIIDAIIARNKLDAGHVNLSTAAKNLIAPCEKMLFECLSDCVQEQDDQFALSLRS